MEQYFDLFYQSNTVCTDTRKIEAGCLFICLKGPNFNANEFAYKALELGAKYVIVDEEKYANGSSIFYVPDALLFLQKLALHHRNKFDIPFIGITGSNGKTSTKELINVVLSKKFSVLATEGNLNNHIGVPLTLLKINATHEIAIIEMGANKFKDIEELCSIAEPTHGIITNIGKAHLEGFGSFEGVLLTKSELYTSLKKNKGTIVYNQDDEILINALPRDVRKFSYGTTSKADIIGVLTRLTPFVHFVWHTSDDPNEQLVEGKMVGKYNFYNYLAAVAFGKLFNVSDIDISKALEDYTPVNNRSQVEKTEANTLIMDCYNANPTSMKSALESFHMIHAENKTAILGDMLELGDESIKEHQAIADLLVELSINAYTVGKEFKNVASTNFLKQFTSIDEDKTFFTINRLRDQFVLLKGSRGIKLEELKNLL